MAPTQGPLKGCARVLPRWLATAYTADASLLDSARLRGRAADGRAGPLHLGAGEIIAIPSQRRTVAKRQGLGAKTRARLTPCSTTELLNYGLQLRITVRIAENTLLSRERLQRLGVLVTIKPPHARGEHRHEQLLLVLILETVQKGAQDSEHLNFERLIIIPQLPRDGSACTPALTHRGVWTIYLERQPSSPLPRPLREPVSIGRVGLGEFYLRTVGRRY